jgi:hypothetical protein
MNPNNLGARQGDIISPRLPPSNSAPANGNPQSLFLSEPSEPPVNNSAVLTISRNGTPNDDKAAA